jgi:hypothetical protein
MFEETTPPSRERGYYMRTIKARVQSKKKSLVVSLKGLYAKTN